MGRILKPEKKFYDIDITNTNIAGVATNFTTNGVHTNSQTIVGIPQGTTENERIGRKCTVTNIYARLSFDFLANAVSNISAGDSSQEMVRVMMYWDKQCNGAAAASTDLLETNLIHSFRNLANSKRFVVLYDRTFTWNATTTGGGNGTANDSAVVRNNYLVKISKKCFIPIEFLLTTGALTSNIASNNIAMIIWGKNGNIMQIETGSKIRIRFIDY